MSNKRNKNPGSLTVAVLQMVSTANLEENLGQAGRLIEEAAGKSARLILLPENFAMFSSSRFRDVARQEVNQSVISDFLGGLSKKHDCYVVAGSVPLPAESGKVFSACLVFSPEGKQLARYDKIHLFDVDVEDNVGSYRESDYIEAGADVESFEVDGVRVGLSICYDLRFPELYRELVRQSCEVFVVPAAFTYTTGQKHWEVLLRARAIENQCFVLAANQGGEHETSSGQVRKTYGHSMIVDDQGRVLGCHEFGPGVVVENLDLAKLRKSRSAMPVLEHRRI